jgi:O-antigen/teichoic acid export membrane protein
LKILKVFNSKQIRTAAIGSLSVKFLSALFTFLNSILLARILGLEQFGIYTLVIATTIILTVPNSIGIPNLIIRYVSKYEVTKNYRAIKGLLKSSLRIALLNTMIIWVIAILSYFIWWNQFDEYLVRAFWYGLILLPLLVLGSLKAASLKGLRFIILGQIAEVLLRNGILFFGLLICLFINLDMTPDKAVLIHIVAASISLFFGYLFLYRKLHVKTKDIVPEYKNRMWLKETLPFALNNGIQVSKSKAISYILAVFSSIESVAIFDIAMRASALVSFTLDAINSSIAPHISSAFEKKNITQLQRLLTKSSRIIFLSALPVVLIFILGGTQLITFLFGNEFSSSYTPIIILSIGQLVNAGAGSVGIVLFMTGNQLYFTKVVAVLTIIYIVLSIPAIIYYDVIGSAVILSLLLVVQNLILVFYVKKKLRINTAIF